ncbi:MAG: pilus assembly protein N-terminal domain-containing protein, partial [Hyphomonas sp.]|nr:pilus assembly protein N-terminal domain-containing protein [Hyphomonas sp.]
VHDEKLIFVTGKEFGTTNLLIYDAAGRQIYSTDIRVTDNEASIVTVNRSGDDAVYDCAPNCRYVSD